MATLATFFYKQIVNATDVTGLAEDFSFLD
jgi:hypothetical protein